MSETSIGEVWRDLHNLVAAMDALVRLRDTFRRARDLETQVLSMDERFAAVQAEYEKKTAALAQINTDFAAADDRYQSKIGALEQQHADRKAELDAEYADKRKKLDDALASANQQHSAALSTISETLAKRQTDSQAEVARLVAEEENARAVLAGVERSIEERRKQLDGLKAAAARMAAGG